MTIHAHDDAGAPIKTLVKVVSIMAFSGACAGLLVSVQGAVTVCGPCLILFVLQKAVW